MCILDPGCSLEMAGVLLTLGRASAWALVDICRTISPQFPMIWTTFIEIFGDQFDFALHGIENTMGLFL